ncbi:aminoglycoside phosphotransferase [Angustibacter sp. McL0619]|uniref:aminoglycoside phosphotransferase n=1 Tax=Angustibacter sp. McL0619 TaxID=3415676 RepID=UPI003CF6559D
MDDARPTVDYTASVVRPDWTELPEQVRQAVGRAAGSPVTRAEPSATSGFSGGFAAVVHLADGRRVFAKAGSSTNPHLCTAYAQEALVLQGLPPGVPSPAFVGAGRLDPGEADEHEWRIVIAEVAQGRLPQPWTERDLEAAHDACLASAQALTPAPSWLDLPRLVDKVGLLPDVQTCFPRLLSGDLVLTTGQPGWLPGRFTELADLVAGCPPHLDGDTACHTDLRADNMLVGPAGAVFVDWNWLMRGAAWTDFVGLLPLARLDGVDVDVWLRRSPLTRDVAAESVDAWLAALVAFMLPRADEPVWPGGPQAVRDHQRLYAHAFAQWLGVRRGWVDG